MKKRKKQQVLNIVEEIFKFSKYVVNTFFNILFDTVILLKGGHKHCIFNSARTNNTRSVMIKNES